jgi:hypothetical protein
MKPEPLRYGELDGILITRLIFSNTQMRHWVPRVCPQSVRVVVDPFRLGKVDAIERVPSDAGPERSGGKHVPLSAAIDHGLVLQILDGVAKGSGGIEEGAVLMRQP